MAVDVAARARHMTLQQEYRLLFSVFGSFWLLVACVVALVPARSEHNLTAIALVLLLPPLAATASGPLVAAGAAVLTAVVFDVFFTRPYNSPRIESSDSVAAFVAYLVVAVVVAVVVARMREARALADERLAEAELLQALTSELVGGGDARRPLVHLAHALSLRGATLHTRRGGERLVVSTGDAAEADREAARVLAGASAGGPGRPACFPVRTPERKLGVLVVDPGEEPLGAERQRLVTSFAGVLALALAARD
jgi:K+-sensing histidine kinase KdpD